MGLNRDSSSSYGSTDSSRSFSSRNESTSGSNRSPNRRAPSPFRYGTSVYQKEKETVLTPRETVLTIILWVVIGFYVMLIYTLLYGFFPSVALHKAHIGHFEVGFIIGVYDLTTGCGVLFFGQLIKYVNIKATIVTCQVLMGLTILLSGFTEHLTGTTFFLLHSGARGFEGIFEAGVSVALFALVPMFPEHLQGTLVGLFEMFYALGMAAGAPLGGFLFYQGGFSMPFIVVGAASLPIGILAYLAVKTPELDDSDNGDSNEVEPVKFWSFLWNPEYMFCILSSILFFSTLTVTGATLQLYLEYFNFEPYEVGLVVGLPTFVYAISTPIFGHFLNKYDLSLPTLLIALVTTGVSLIFLGPAPMIPLERSIWLLMVSLIILGLGNGAGCPFCFIYMTEIAKREEENLSIATSAVLSSWYLSAIAIGGFLGPTISGLMIPTLGTDNTYFIFGISCILLAMLYAIWHYCCNCRVSYYEEEEDKQDLND